MKNLLKFLLFVGILSAGISALYDYRMKHGGLGSGRTPEKYTLATMASVQPQEVPTLDALSRERRTLISSVIPSVVSIRTSKRVPIRRQYMDPFEFFYRNSRQFRNPQEQAMVQASLGSGFIVSEEGHIITNNHVVDQVDEIEVQMHDGNVRKARLVGADAQVDLAVLKLDDTKGVKPLKFGDSDAVQAGDFVLAIGNPFGFEETVTDGIISSKGRPNRVDGFGDFLQTNAAINPGNSGGPLINLRGEVVGINTAIISRSGGSQGIGFAIPSNSAKSALESLLKQGRIIRGYLGIQMQTPQRGQPEPDTDGIVVQDVIPGSPAAEAQIQPGDVIRKFDGKEVKSFTALRSLVSQAELNKDVELEIIRNGKPMTVKTQIKEQPIDYQTARAPRQQRQPAPAPGQPGPGLQTPPVRPDPDEPLEEDLQDNDSALAGIDVGELTPELARRLNVPANVRGVVVTNVEQGAGDLRRGDVIEEVNQQPVTSVAEYRRIVGELDPAGTHVLSVARGRTRSFVVVRGR